VIHHDLDWNPSVLEQRTGRLDRIRSKSARSKQPIVVYEPYLAGTQDERMFRVVKDREQWFNVVMGDRVDPSERASAKLAERVPLPPELAQELAMKLAVYRG
jgi:SNF2 family DNA or RNA helicase